MMNNWRPSCLATSCRRMVPPVIYLYARFSTDRQTESSIDDQLRRCRDYAAARGWSVEGEFTDHAISGAAFGNRPGVLAALAMLGRGDVLLVADLSRLSRSQDLAPLMERLRFRGAKVIGVLDGFDSDSPQARMQAGLAGIMSDELRASIRVRTHSALELRALSGRPTGGKAYGFDAAGQPIEAEVAVVREVFDRYAAGDSLKAIASDLNHRGVPAAGATWARAQRRTDGRWVISALHALLKNERYAGRVVWNRSQWVKDPDSGKRARRLRPKEDWIVAEVPAIVDDTTWRRARARAAERGGCGPGPGGQPKYLLSGLLVCDRCGGRMIVTGNKGSAYYCATHRQGGPAACDMRVGVRRAVAEQVLLRPVVEDLLSPAAVAHATALIRRWARQERAQEVGGQNAEAAEIETRIARLAAQVEAGVVDADDVVPALEALRARRDAALRSSWRRAGARTSAAAVPAEALYAEAAAAFRQRLVGGKLQEAREALRELMDPVRVRPDETGTYLVAQVGVNATPLLEAAGIASNGSGGGLWPRAQLILELRRVA